MGQHIASKMGRRVVNNFAWPLCTFLSACAAADRPGSVVVRDSAGITIIESEGPVWSRGDGWTLSPEPVLQIGVAEGDPRYELYRVSAALRLPDGRVVVANAGTRELRIYDEQGRHLVSVGGQGSGPGEFRNISRMYALESDSLLVYDDVLSRLSVFGTDGRYVRTFRFEPVAYGFTWPLAYLVDGTILASSGRPMGSRNTTGLERDTALFLRFDLEGAMIDSLGRFPVSERYVRIADNGIRSTVGRPFARWTQVSVAGEGFYVGTADSYHIEAYSPGGRLERILRTERPNRPVTPADIERYKEWRMARVNPRLSASARRALEEAPFPATMPAYQALLTDAEGNLWVEDYRAPGEEERTWTIFDPEGRVLGRLEVPDGLKVVQVGSDFVLGLHQDEFGVEQVRVYRLDRTE